MSKKTYLCENCFGDLLDSTEGAEFDTETTCSCCGDETKCAEVVDENDSENNSENE